MSPSPRSKPFSGSEPPALEEGQERRYMVANPSEDMPEAVKRAKGKFSWGVAIVGRPWRVQSWWLFTVETAKLVKPAAAVG